HESKFIRQLVMEVFCKLDHLVSNVEENLVGIDSRVDAIKSLLELRTNDVRFIGIWGMGGIGKTTIATAVFDNICHQFEGAIFVHDVQEKSKKNGLESLQEIVISEILSQRDVKVRSISHGVQWRSSTVCHKKALVILDDVDSMGQVNALAGNRDWFGKGSRVIITTNDKKILVDSNVTKIHTVRLLSVSVKLFNMNAFEQIHHPKEFKELSGLITWRSAADRLKDIPEDEIIEKLRVSFDHGLKPVEQDIFLDIACFFKGEKEYYAERVLDSFDFYPGIGIPVLIEKSLIVISEGKLQMHDLIQEMGCHIVRQAHPREPGKCSRLWDPEEVCDVLTKNMGTEKVKGLQLDLPKPTDVQCFSSNSLRNLYNLRLLKFCNVYLCEDVEYLPNQLRWLRWHQYPSKSLPASFQAAKVVGLEMRCSHLEKLWTGMKLVDKLKFVDLSHSQKLSRTPDFEGIPNLQSLVLENCISLIGVHQSIAFHINMRSLPDKIQLESLEVLVLSDCIILDDFPDIQGDMHNLSEIFLDGTAIKVLPSTIEYLRNLVLLDLTRYCSKLEKLPEDLQNLKLLEELHADRTAIVFLPRCIGFLKKLKILSFRGCEDTILTQSWSLPFVLPTVSGCRKLKVLPELPPSIVELYADNCSHLQVLVDPLSKYKKLFTVSLINCSELADNIAGTLWQYLLHSACVLEGLRVDGIYQGSSILVPGTQIPKHFGNENRGRSISIKLPPQWYNDRFMGFAIYVVVESISDFARLPHAKSSSNNINMRARVVTHDHKEENFTWDNIFKFGTKEKVDPKHVFLAYIRFRTAWRSLPLAALQPNDCSLLEFFLFDDRFMPYMSKPSVIHRGVVRLIYEKDVKMKDQTMLIQSQLPKMFVVEEGGLRTVYEENIVVPSPSSYETLLKL
ncbi:hypothetical protein RJ640_001269, partial [Escallonia rubra]